MIDDKQKADLLIYRKLCFELIKKHDKEIGIETKRIYIKRKNFVKHYSYIGIDGVSRIYTYTGLAHRQLWLFELGKILDLVEELVSYDITGLVVLKRQKTCTMQFQPINTKYDPRFGGYNTY